MVLDDGGDLTQMLHEKYPEMYWIVFMESVKKLLLAFIVYWK